MTGGWAGAILCGPGTVAGWACFVSFEGSAIAALTKVYGTQSAAAILAANAGLGATAAFQAVANAGHDPRGTTTNAGYGERMGDTVDLVNKRVDCLKNNGYL